MLKEELLANFWISTLNIYRNNRLPSFLSRFFFVVLHKIALTGKILTLRNKTSVVAKWQHQMCKPGFKLN